MHRKVSGFTLIELMIVLVVATVILTIAIPAFNAQLRKSRRSEVLSQLQSIVLLQEKWRSSHSTYGTTADMGSPTATHYTIAVSGATAIEFTITATAKSGDGQNNDIGSGGASCATLWIASSNGSQTKNPATCWQ